MLDDDDPERVESQRRTELLLLRQMAKAIERLFSPFCEVIIHDFSDLEHSIIHIEGALSGRSIGGAATDLLLRRVRNGDTRQDLYNYRTTLPGDRKIKSSTIFLRDPKGRAYGAFCVNYDMTALVGLQRVLADMTRLEIDEAVTETLSDDVNTTVQTAVAESLAELAIGTLALSRDDKVELIARLDRKGIFEMKRAATMIADQFGISRATIYNYLREARERSGTAAPAPTFDEEATS